MSETQDTFNLNDYLPHGTMLRDLLRDSQVTEGDIKEILRNRGIYIQDSDKTLTIPILMTCLLSSSEFNLLRDKHIKRDDFLKHRTIVLELDSDTHKLHSLIGKPNIIEPQNVHYKLLSDPKFQIRESGKAMVFDYKIEKTNRSRDWSSHNTIHNGAVLIRQNGSKVHITSQFTTKEIKEYNDKLVKEIERKFKESKHLRKDNPIVRITSGDFSNIERIKFLLSFTSGSSDTFLQFLQIPYVSFGPDRSKQLPEEMGWMQDRVHALMIRGEKKTSLHDLDFISKSEYQNYVILESVDANFYMEHKGRKIYCSLNFGFFKYLKTLDAATEFEVHISNLSVYNYNGKKMALSSKEQREIEVLVLERFDGMKLENYEKILKERQTDLKRVVI